MQPATIVPIPPAHTTRILVASPVRKPLLVVQQFLRTLVWQRLRRPTQVDALFVPNFAPADVDATAAIAALNAFPGATVWPNESRGDGYTDGPQTRQWSGPAFGRLATLKNRILQYALDHSYDFVWLVDTDVMSDPGTLQSLLDAAEYEAWIQNPLLPLPIVAGVYWTRWQLPGGVEKVHAGPQVWLVHPYGLSGRGWTEQEFRAALVERRRVRVWGLGACTLIPMHALRKGVSFARFEGLPPGPMSEGEDRHFCAHAAQRHVGMFADAWPDIYHAYHPSEYTQLGQRVNALDYQPLDQPRVGSLVSAKLELLEPVSDDHGRWFKPAPRYLRGPLGTLPTLPQVEETLATLAVGQSTLIKLQFPSHWPNRHLRLQARIARVTLLDAKPFRVPPTIDEELFVGGGSRRAIDTTTLAEGQLDELYADIHPQQ